MENNKIENILVQILENQTKMQMDIDGIKTELTGVKTDLKSVKTTVMKIEQDHGQKLDALFDGYKQNSNKIDRIEKEVSKHEEVILRRVK